MNMFRVLLGILFVGLGIYTILVGVNHGWNILPIFFSEMVAMTWAGQFNMDFLGFLILSGLWLAWRHHFSPAGFALGACGLFGGIMFLTPYLVFHSYKANGDMAVLFLGPVRAAR